LHWRVSVATVLPFASMMEPVTVLFTMKCLPIFVAPWRTSWRRVDVAAVNPARSLDRFEPDQ